MEGRRTEELVVTDTNRPDRTGVKTDNKGSVLCLTDCTSGTLSDPLATRLLSLRLVYLLRCDENGESTASEGCTETMTSLARYAILATKEQAVSYCSIDSIDKSPYSNNPNYISLLCMSISHVASVLYASCTTSLHTAGHRLLDGGVWLTLGGL